MELSKKQWRPLPAPGVTPYQAFYNPADGTYCALGLVLKASGIGDELLARAGFLEDLSMVQEFIPKGLKSPGLAVQIMGWSDEPVKGHEGLGTHERAMARACIKTALAKAGIDARWVE